MVNLEEKWLFPNKTGNFQEVQRSEVKLVGFSSTKKLIFFFQSLGGIPFKINAYTVNGKSLVTNFQIAIYIFLQTTETWPMVTEKD